MTNHLDSGILTEMSDIVINFLNEEGLDLKDESFFAQELSEIRSPDRCEWIKTYLLENTYFLLHGIIDQAYSLDFVLTKHNPAVVSVTGYMLLRTMLEYSYKLTYLTDPEICANERIKRAIEIYYVDLYEYDRLPLKLKVETSQDRKEFAREWYKEVADGEKLKRPIQIRSIFNSIGDPEDEKWPRDRSGKSVNPVYTRGYQVNSAITHGNLWAIKHYGLTHAGKSGTITTALPGLDAKRVGLLCEVAAKLLRLSFGFVVQFTHGHLPSGIMNRLESQIATLTDS